MAKMTKDDAKQAGRKAAEQLVGAAEQAMTLAQLEAMEWSDLRGLVETLKSEALILATDVHDKVRAEWSSAFESRAFAILAARPKARKDALNRFDSIYRHYLRPDAAKAEIIKQLASAPRGTRVEDGWSIRFTIQRGAAHAEVCCRLDSGYDNKGITHPDDPRRQLYVIEPVVEVSWSSSGRSVAEAIVEAGLHRDAAEFAAELECFAKSLKVVRVWEPEQPAAEPTMADIK